MHRHPGHFRFPVHLSGSAASRALRGVQNGQVAAVFCSSFYVETITGFVCIGNETLEPAPLNLITDAPAGTDWSASGVRHGEQVNVSSMSIDIGQRFSFPLSGTTGWQPDPPPKAWKFADLKQGLDAFRGATTERVPREGLGHFLHATSRSENDDPVTRRAQGPILEAQQWLTASMTTPDKRWPDPHWVHPLIGLGPGLTPSGDDFISGMMIALHYLEQSDVRQSVWKLASGRTKDVTTPISYAHLEAASRGEGSRGIHQALTAMMTGQTAAIEDLMKGIDHIGHTSGWDAIAGAVTVFDARLCSHRPHLSQEATAETSYYSAVR